MSAPGQKTYEMLWDCKYCGHKKLLGLSHRHCAECGAPQDTSARYFPSDAEKVAVEDHEFAGIDVVCPSCRQGASSKGKHCAHCGGPLEGAETAARRGDVVRAEGSAFGAESAADAKAEQVARKAPVASKPRKKWPWIVGGVLFGLVALVSFFALWTNEVGLTVSGHTWVREIAVERFAEVSKSTWCDSVPSGARVVRRYDKERSTKQVEDGETCEMRRVDNGNGTFTERRECTTKYKDVPVMDDHCDYRVNEWVVSRKVESKGGLETAPSWPALQLAVTGSCLGCEREGARSETYSVRFTDVAAKSEATCDFDEAKWRTFQHGSKWTGDQRLTGGLVCDGLRAQ